MIAYKATDGDGNTKGGMYWEVGVTNRATGEGNELCTDGVLHVYETPEQAAFMLPAHVEGYTRLFEVEVPEIVANDGTKCGVKEATVLREIPMPVFTTEQRVTIAIRVSLLAYSNPGYVKWAEDWLSGEDRSERAAEAETRATRVAEAEAWAAWAAAWAAAWSAWSACAAAEAAAWAWTAEAAARAAAWAAEPIDLISIIKEVVA